MSVDKAIKLIRSDDQSITVTSGTDTLTIAFFEVPRVSDNAERRFQRVRKPRTDVNETIEDTPGPHNVRFTIYGSPTENNAKDKMKQKQGSRSHFLAIKDDKAFAIRMVGDCNESAFKVKIRVGGVNVLQHTTHGRKSQDYFVVSEQKWVWGKQVGKDTARQFRVFRRERERLSLRYQLRNNNIKKEVEIEITSRHLDEPFGPCSYLPPPPTAYIHVGRPHRMWLPRYNRLRSPLIDMSGPPSSADPTDVVIPLSSNVSSSSSQPQLISEELTSDEPGHCSPSPPPTPPSPVGDALVLRPPSPVESLGSEPSSTVSGTPVYGHTLVTVAAPQSAGDQESIYSDREEDMLPHQMVVGTGGLIEQIVCPDKHPKRIDDETVILKFKIVDDPRHLPKHLQNLEEPKETAVGGMRIRGTGPGGNYSEVPNPPTRTFRALAPVVTDPDGLRQDIRSPMEMELSDDGNGESPESPVDSAEGSMGEREQGSQETDDGGEDGDARGFQVLWGEAENQPRGLMNDIRMKKKRREQRKRGGVGIMAEKREELKSERSSRWRRHDSFSFENVTSIEKLEVHAQAPPLPDPLLLEHQSFALKKPNYEEVKGRKS
ncbi:uncharacterized protein B0T23DRAFT_398204 [Neurospora hispaniola]|uniref:Uncharacterized protein n=1 Tax=Neurospora hispaniola TaxID=588809 RepID=A0AAJ0I1C2_9PEZI|nr:hypothetical protein B0T23DRAFT_398204 [Neurospora hispaniola]